MKNYNILNENKCPMCNNHFNIPFRIDWKYKIISGYDIVNKRLIKREVRKPHKFCSYNCYNEYLSRLEELKMINRKSKTIKLKYIGNDYDNVLNKSKIYEVKDIKWYDEIHKYLYSIKCDDNLHRFVDLFDNKNFELIDY